MNLGRDQILELRRSQGQHDQGVGELEGKVDRNARHTEMLSKYGIDPATTGGQLGSPGLMRWPPGHRNG